MREYLRAKMRELGANRYERYLAGTLINRWAELVGENLSQQMVPVNMSRGKLEVIVSNPCVKEQLKFAKSELQSAINIGLGEEVVKEIIVVGVCNRPSAIEEPEELAVEGLEVIGDENLRRRIARAVASRAKMNPCA